MQYSKQKALDILGWIAERLTERTTYFGLAALIGAAGIKLSPDLGASLVAVGMSVSGLVLVLLKDKPVA